MTELLPGTARRLNALLARAQRGGKLPAIVAGVLRDGRLVWSTGMGEVAGEPGDTQYRIGSITKTFTSVLVLQARDEGLLAIDEPLSAFVPEAPFADRTLRALLSHASGVPGEPEGPWWERSEGGDFAGLVAVNKDLQAANPSGQEFRYSNLAYGLLGEAVARVRGEDWWSLVRTRILAPLGMERTTYQATAPHAQGYSVSHLFNTLTPEPHSDTGAMAPAGQLWSTVDDLARYAGFVLAGHPDVLSAATLSEASTTLQPEGNYGLGFRRLPGGSGRLVGHTGTMPGFRASFFCDRGRGTAVIALSNGTIGQDCETLAGALLGILEECEPTVGAAWLPATHVPDEVRELVGTWHWGETAFEISWNGDELEMVEVRSRSAYEEFHLEDRGWVGTDGSLLDVVRRADGSVSHLLCETYLFTRTPYDPASPVPGR
jgi:CubicO group peptidase (beta-lactamase class C family)